VNTNTAAKVGVALTNCFFCGDGNEIVINSRLTQRDAANVEKLHKTVINMRPCSKCESWMKQGIMLLEIDVSKSTPGWNTPPAVDYSLGRQAKDERNAWMPNPWRTGRMAVIKEEAFKRIFGDDETAQFGLKHRWMFIEQEAANKLGLFVSQ
jgi:hypothetical protein